VRMDAPPQANQAIPWEVWVPIADKPSEEDLAPEAVVKVKQVPSERQWRCLYKAHGASPVRGKGMQICRV